MNHIELFAGCGGLSLGLEAAGFELLMANEISPMASETFAYNLLDEDLASKAEGGERVKNVLWIKSNYPDLKRRLREDPFTFPKQTDAGFSDFPTAPECLKGKLVVGSVVELNRLLESDKELLGGLRRGFDSEGGLDLVSGGPPCQSFSMAGLRERHSDKNSLPWEFAKFVELTKPKVALLENVTGILRAFSGDDGTKYHAWYEVAKAFALIGYIPLCLHVNAKFTGVPQNRPRFILIAVREDYFRYLKLDLALERPASERLFHQSLEFFNLVKKNGGALEFGHLNYFDVQKEEHKSFFEDTFLGPLVGSFPVSVKAAIDDLKGVKVKQSGYVKELNKLFADVTPRVREVHNHELRRHYQVVRRRFRIYQVLQYCDSKAVAKEIISLLRGDISELSSDSWSLLERCKFLHDNGKLEAFTCKRSLEQYLRKHKTKKQTQKALEPNLPAPASLSIPDDACHYDEGELRVLTVREMARIQSFPDSFVFRSKVTTGGQMRKFEVPQYTQVGNAVPPLLGFALGKVVEALLKG